MPVPTLVTPIFDHISLGVAELERSVAFYDAALLPLGCVRLWQNARAAGYGPPGFEGEAPFALIAVGNTTPPPALHLAFMAPNRGAVDAFWAAAVATGGRDDGPPGTRLNYDPGYYAAFVCDPDGHRIEAVVHEQH